MARSALLTAALLLAAASALVVASAEIGECHGSGVSGGGGGGGGSQCARVRRGAKGAGADSPRLFVTFGVATRQGPVPAARDTLHSQARARKGTSLSVLYDLRWSRERRMRPCERCGAAILNKGLGFGFRV